MSGELFAPSLEDLIACAEREVRLRQQVYRRQIAAGRLTRDKAEREIALMEAIVQELRRRESR